LKLTRAVSTMVEGHAAGEYNRISTLTERGPFGRSQTPQDGGLRQPA
jgi:hypothetical protein